MQILAAVAVFLFALGGIAAFARHTARPARRPAARARGRGGPYRRSRKSWLVTAAKAAGVKVSSDDLSGAGAELTGRATGHTARAGGRLARWGARHTGRAGLAAGRWAERHAGRRWQARTADSPPAPPLWWHRHPPDDGLEPPGEPAPGSTPSAATGEPGSHAENAGPTPPPTPASAPAASGRARKKEITTMRHRYAINLERPSTDAEFLESCVQLGVVLKALAEEVSDWAEGLSGLHLPPSVLSPLHSLCEGIEEAATGASNAAKAFEDEFEDARDVASRGMHFTGEDAA